jgi:hypothetical protein
MCGIFKRIEAKHKKGMGTKQYTSIYEQHIMYDIRKLATRSSHEGFVRLLVRIERLHDHFCGYIYIRMY